jgi:hypothetical protein
MSLSFHFLRYLQSACAAALVVSVGLSARIGLGQEDEKKTDLPIQRIVMFSSGVAFFEHNGQVEGNAEVELKFNVKDVNDLLKSMVLQDEGGGRISTVSYASKDPITRTLGTFSIDLTSNPTLADLLSQIRGEQVEIEAPTKIVGTILGVEKRQVPTGKDDTVVEVSYVNLLTEEGLRSVSLENVGRIKISNATLDAELRQALLVLASGKSQDKKAVSLSFLGQGKRPVRVGYIQEAPIWKTSYRLVLADDAPPFLQGWAIVENTTESDWNDVNLTLVSGRPISFVMDLYEPMYLDRPVVEPELFASLRPRTYDQDLAKKEAEFKGKAEQATIDERNFNLARRGAMPAAPPAPAAAGRPGDFGYLAKADEKARAIQLQQGVQSVAQASDVGEMFRYTIATPVKLGRGKSAMLPIVNESVQGEKVSIYNESTHAKHPLNGLKLKNSTELHLMQGPITVFDDASYAGDAQIQDLPPGSERLISYAMDLDTEVAPVQKDDPRRLTSVKIAKGTLQTSHKYARTKSYLVKNSGKKESTVLVEYPIQQPWTLVEPKEPAEKTRGQYRFAVKAEPGKPVTLDVKEEYTQSEQVALTNLDSGTIAYYLNQPVVSEAVKKALRDVVARQAAIQQMAQKRQELERQLTVIDQEQKRIRDNMAQLDKDTELYRKYVTKLTEQEDLNDNFRKQVTEAINEEQKLRKALDDFLLGLELA